MELIANHTYEAKRPKAVGLAHPLADDRMIVWVGELEVQYDSPSVRLGRRLPKVSKEAFLRWAKRDITDEMPKGEWRAFKSVRPNTPNVPSASGVDDEAASG